MVLLARRCADCATPHLTLGRRSGAPARQIFILGAIEKICQPDSSKSAHNLVLEFSSAEALLGQCWLKVIIGARAFKTTCQAINYAYQAQRRRQPARHDTLQACATPRQATPPATPISRNMIF